MRVAWFALAASGCQLAFPLELDTSGENAPTAGGLAARYTMKIGDDGSAHDETGSGHEGTCLLPDKCPVNEPGQHGEGARFDGIDDAVRVNVPPTLTLGGFTIVFWVRLDYAAATDITEYRGMVTTPLGDSPNLNSYALGVDPGGVVRFDSAFMNPGTGPANQRTTSGPIDVGRYHQIAGRLTADDKTLFVDGNVAATQHQDNPVLFEPGPMLIGCDLDVGAPVLNVLGAIDEVQIYDLPLTDNQIFDLARIVPDS